MLAALSADMFREQYAERVRRRRALAGAAGADRRSLRVGSRLDLHPAAAVPREPVDAARAAGRDHGRARAGAARRQHHDRSHLAGGIDQGRHARPGKYLIAHGVEPKDFNSYGARRGNHEVMMRGTFANVRLRNQLAPGTEGGFTTLSARRRRDVDLRRVDEVSGGRRAARRSSRARNTARVRRATGRRRARCCSA